jgi:hypothetical protein
LREESEPKKPKPKQASLVDGLVHFMYYFLRNVLSLLSLPKPKPTTPHLLISACPP